MSDPIRAIVVGTSFGGRVHVPALRAAGIEVRALVGRDAERTRGRATQLGVPHAAISLNEALSFGRVDCVTVATPPHAHAPVVLEALRAGKHVLCEKPFAADASEASSMVAAAEAAGVVALTGCEFRWMPDEALARRVIRGGGIGEPRVAAFVQHSGILAKGLHGAFNEEWWFDREHGGGMLGAGGIHFIDRFRTWLGDIARVSAVLQVAAERPSHQAEDTYTALLQFDSGCLGMMQHSSAVHGKTDRLCRVIGSAGTVWLDDGRAWFADAASMQALDVPDDLRLPDPPPPSDDPKHAFTQLELPPYTRLAERFRDLIEGRPIPSDAPETPTFDDGLYLQRVLDAMRSSSVRGGAWTEVPPVGVGWGRQPR
jgi:predicted dehydrogenase